MQEGEPLNPLLFCLTIHHRTTQLRSELHVFHLDDGTLGVHFELVIHNLRLVEFAAVQLDLKLNIAELEVICKSSTSLEGFVSAAPGF